MKVLKEVSWKLLFKFKSDNGEFFYYGEVSKIDIDKEPIIFPK